MDTATPTKARGKAGAKTASGTPRRKAAPKEGRRERNKREKQARIVAAARALFRAKGYADTTTQEIADAADVGSGTLFLYAKSKEDLLVLVFRDEMTELIEKVSAKIPEKALFLTKVEALFDGFIAYHGRDMAIARALIRELTFLSNPDRHDEVRAIPTAIGAKIAEFLVLAQKRGEIREDVPAFTAAHSLFSVYYYLLITWLGGYSDDETFRRDMHERLAFLIDSMKAAPSRRTAKSG